MELRCVAHALPRRSAAAGTRVHRSDEQEIGREYRIDARARHDDSPILEGLAETVEHLGSKFSDLVKKERSRMRERNQGSLDDRLCSLDESPTHGGRPEMFDDQDPDRRLTSSVMVANGYFDPTLQTRNQGAA